MIFEPEHPCRLMPTRDCPPSYGGVCGDRPCARLESNDPAPWAPITGPPAPLPDPTEWLIAIACCGGFVGPNNEQELCVPCPRTVWDDNVRRLFKIAERDLGLKVTEE